MRTDSWQAPSRHLSRMGCTLSVGHPAMLANGLESRGMREAQIHLAHVAKVIAGMGRCPDGFSGRARNRRSRVSRTPPRRSHPTSTALTARLVGALGARAAVDRGLYALTPDHSDTRDDRMRRRGAEAARQRSVSNKILLPTLRLQQRTLAFALLRVCATSSSRTISILRARRCRRRASSAARRDDALARARLVLHRSSARRATTRWGAEASVASAPLIAFEVSFSNTTPGGSRGFAAASSAKAL